MTVQPIRLPLDFDPDARCRRCAVVHNGAREHGAHLPLDEFELWNFKLEQRWFFGSRRHCTERSSFVRHMAGNGRGLPIIVRKVK